MADKSIALVREHQMNDWLESAQPGAQLTYARGFNALDAIGESFLERLHRLARGGYLNLKQRRVPDGVGFFYVAERSSRPLSARPLNADRPAIGAGRV